MLIEYALTRKELLLTFFAALARSAAFMKKMVLLSVGVGAVSLVSHFIATRRIGVGDLVMGLGWAAGFFLFVPLWTGLRGKTEVRKLALSDENISTEIGQSKATILWKSVSFVAQTPGHIIICGRSGNYFAVPDRAFASGEQRLEFLAFLHRHVGSST